MNTPVPTANRPVWVKVGLWLIHSRKTALGYFWLSVALAVLSVVAGAVVAPRYYVGVIFLLAALWYWLCIAWVDRNNNWPPGA